MSSLRGAVKKGLGGGGAKGRYCPLRMKKKYTYIQALTSFLHCLSMLRILILSESSGLSFSDIGSLLEIKKTMDKGNMDAEQGSALK